MFLDSLVPQLMKKMGVTEEEMGRLHPYYRRGKFLVFFKGHPRFFIFFHFRRIHKSQNFAWQNFGP
jgi:hypothetical protein